MKSIIITTLTVLGIVLLGSFIFMIGKGDSRLEQAANFYQKGEKATTIIERSQAFNQALDLYLQLDRGHHPRHGNGALYYNIGNTYFQLGEYPRAILYYHRAQALQPRNHQIARNLDVVNQKLELQKGSQTNGLGNFFVFNSLLSIPERIQIFFGLCVLFFGFLIVNTWWPYSQLRIGAIVCGIALSLVSLSLIYTYYFSPIKAIIVRPVEMRRDAGLQYAKVDGKLLSAGMEVEVLSTTSSGDWLKIVTPKGELGFVPQSTIEAE